MDFPGVCGGSIGRLCVEGMKWNGVKGVGGWVGYTTSLLEKEGC